MFKKDHLLAIAILVLLIAGYQLAFKKTIIAWQLNRHLQQQLMQSADVSVQPQYQRRKNTNLEKVINLYHADSSEFRASTLNNITAIAAKEQVKLSEVPLRDPLNYTAGIIIQRLKFDGNFFSLTKTLGHLQNTPGAGIVRSVLFKTATDLSGKEKVKKLTMELYWEIYDK